MKITGLGNVTRFISARVWARSSWGKSTPLLVPNGAMDPARILEIYRAESRLVPVNYSAIVVARLQELIEENA